MDLLPPVRPEQLLDPHEAAKRLWEFWVMLMKTDGVVGAQEMPEWNEAEDDTKDCFIEAVASKISKPLKNYVDQVESTGVQIKEAQPTPPQYQPAPAAPLFQKPCYTCSVNAVMNAGDVCYTCYLTYNQLPIPD